MRWIPFVILVGCAHHTPTPEPLAPLPYKPMPPSYLTAADVIQEPDWTLLPNDLAAAAEVQDAVETPNPHPNCGDFVLQWAWVDAKHAGPSVTYPGGACDPCIIGCGVIAETRFDNDPDAHERSELLREIFECIETHCPEAKGQDHP